MSLNQLLTDQPRPQIADSAIALGRRPRRRGRDPGAGLGCSIPRWYVSVGNYSAVLENGVLVGTPDHPVRDRAAHGLRAPRHHRRAPRSATCARSATAQSSCPAPGWATAASSVRAPSFPPDSVHPDRRRARRPATSRHPVRDRRRPERLAVLRGTRPDLTDYPGTGSAAHPGRRAAWARSTPTATRSPRSASRRVLFDSAEVTGDVVIGERSIIGAGVKIIGDSHGPVRIGSRVQILENTVLHLLPDNELIIDDDVVIGPGAMIHGCQLAAGSVIEPAAIVCDWSLVGAESLVRAGRVCEATRSVRRTVDPRRVPGQTGRHASRAAACADLGPPSRCRRDPAQGAALTVSASHSVSAKRQSWEARDSRNGALRILPTALCGRESMTRISLGTLNFARTPRACSNSSAMSNCAP